MDDHTLLGIVAIVGLVVVWIVNTLYMKLDGILASAIVSSITGIVTYVIGYRRGNKRTSK